MTYVLANLDKPDPTTTVMVGDRHHDIDGARLNGLASIAVTWGYAIDGELEAAHPDRIVSTVPELAAVLKDGATRNAVRRVLQSRRARSLMAWLGSRPKGRMARAGQVTPFSM